MSDPGYTPADVDGALARVRAACLCQPDATERPSHGSPAFFVAGQRCFVMFLDNHHDDGRLAIWCAAPEGAQADLLDTEPDTYFRPPYVGHRGWIGVHLLAVDQPELDQICREAYECVARVRR